MFNHDRLTLCSRDGEDCQESLLQKVCYSTENEVRGLDLKEQKERGRSTDSLSTFLARVV